MASPALKSLITVTVGAIATSGLLASSKSAEAALLTYDFQVLVNQGVYAGTYTGYFSFETSKLVPCLTEPSRLCATPGQSNVTLNFNFLGSTYTEKSDVDYRPSGFQFPAIYYFPENVSRGLDPFLLSLVVQPPTSPISFSILGNLFYMGFETYPNENGPFQGTVRYALRPPKPGGPPDKPPGKPPGNPGNPGCPTGNCAAIPEPSEVTGTAAAMIGLGLLWKLRRKRASQNSNFKR